MTKPSTGVQLFLQGGMYTLGLFCLRAGNFLLIPLYTALLTTEEYGTVGVVEMVAGLLIVFAVSAQTNSMLRLGVDAEGSTDGIGKLLSSVLVWAFLAGIVLTGLGWLAWPLFGDRLGGIPLWPVGVAGLVGVAGAAVFQIVLAFLQLSQRAREHTLLSIQRWFLLLGGVLVFLVALDWGAAGLLLATGLSFIFAGFLGLRKLPDGIRFSIDPPILKASLLYSLPLLPHVLSGIIFQATDRTLIAAHAGLDEAGIYTLASRLASAIFMVAMGMQRAWLPFFLREDRDAGVQGWERVRKLSFFSILVVAFAAIGMGLFAPEIIGLIAPDSYAAAATVVPILALSCFVRSYYLLAVAVILANKGTARLIALATLPAAGLNVWLNALWIPEYGVTGAAWATCLSFATSVALSGLLARKARKVPFKYGKALLLLGAVAGVLYLGPEQSLGGRLLLSLGFAGFVAVLDGRDLLNASRSVLRQLRARNEEETR